MDTGEQRLYFYEIGDNDSHLTRRDRLQSLSSYGKLQPDGRFVSKNEGIKKHIYRLYLTHSLSDETELRNLVTSLGMITMPKSIEQVTGLLYLKREGDSLSLYFQEKEEDEHDSLIIKMEKEYAQVVRDFAQSLQNQYKQSFQDVTSLFYPNLVYIPKSVAPDMKTAYMERTSFDELVSDMMNDYVMNITKERVFYYTASMNSYALYLPSQISNGVKKQFR